MRAPLGDVEDLKEGMVAIVGVNFDMSTTGRRGARYSPLKIRESSQYYANRLEGTGVIEITTGEVLEKAERSRILDLSDMNVYPMEWPKTEAALRSQMTNIASRGPIIVVLGGDHLITYPLVQGFRDGVVARGGKKIGYIQFSSALDLGSTDPLWGKVWRGVTARQILDTETVDPRNMVWVGVNGYQPQREVEFARETGLKVFSLDDVRRDGIERVTEEALRIAGDGSDTVYASVDYDVVDGGNTPGAAATHFQGITNAELLRAVDMLGRGPVGAMDLVGANPLLELLSETAERFGAWLVFRFLWPYVRSGGTHSLPLEGAVRDAAAASGGP
jgi:arginase family enzyme